jgi:uncharacterized membrane protein YqgA involved in biofilm formation
MLGHPPTERKVKAATAGASVGTAAAALVTWALVRYVFPKDMDPTVQGAIVAAIPAATGGVLAFASGWWAKHTPRPPEPVAPAA